MYLSNIKLRNFRNFSELNLKLENKLNVFVGENAQGKTSLLEAVYILGRGKSYKNSIGEIISWEKNSSILEGCFQKGNLRDWVKISVEKPNKSSISINDKDVRSKSNLMEKVYIVLFNPDDLKIIKGGPIQRRKFIDNELSAVLPRYESVIKDYNKVLYQRNNLLKSIKLEPSNKDTLNIWDEQLVIMGIKVIRGRIAFLKKLNKITKTIHNHLTDGRENIQLYYQSNIVKNDEDLRCIEGIYRQLLKESLKQDLIKGYTSIGPHLDDIKVMINDYDAKVFGSQGQQRTAALSMKLSEIELIKHEKNENPIILLDDVMSELDNRRQERIMDYFQTCQVLITCTEINFKKFLQNWDEKIYTVKRGKITG